MNLIVAMLVINGLVLVGQVLISVILYRMQRDMSVKINEAVRNVEQKLIDPKTYRPLFKDFEKRLQGQWANRVSQMSKKYKRLKEEVSKDSDGLDLGSMFFEALDNEEGIIDYAMRNKEKVTRTVKALQNGPSPEATSLSPSPDTAEEGEGPPSWWKEEDQRALEEFVLSRSPNGKS